MGSRCMHEMNMGDDIDADYKMDDMRRVQSTLPMGERLISATVGSPEHMEWHSRVRVSLGTLWQSLRQTEGERSTPAEGPIAVARASLSSVCLANGSLPISLTIVV